MTTPEQAAWNSLRPVLQSLSLDPHRVENVVGPAFPDVDYAFGNIELKAMAEFPMRPDTLVKVPEFTGAQAGWLYRRWMAGGLSWLSIRVGHEWYWFDGQKAMLVYKGLTEAQWKSTAMVYGRMMDTKVRLDQLLRGKPWA